MAAFCSWHVHHRAASQEIERRLRAGEAMVVAAQTLVETYAVLTRLPAPHRLAPHIAYRLLQENLRACQAFSLGPEEVWKLIANLSRNGVGGGCTYDALVAATAASAGIECVLTLNERDFVRVAPSTLRVARPRTP